MTDDINPASAGAIDESFIPATPDHSGEPNRGVCPSCGGAALYEPDVFGDCETCEGTGEHPDTLREMRASSLAPSGESSPQQRCKLCGAVADFMCLCRSCAQRLGESSPPDSSPEKPDAFSTLDRLAKLAPNWDSYGGASPDPRAIDTARKVMSLGARFWPVPMSNGGIQVEAHGDGIDIEIAIPPEGTSEVLWPDDDRPSSPEKLDEDEALLRSVERLAEKGTWTYDSKAILAVIRIARARRSSPEKPKLHPLVGLTASACKPSSPLPNDEEVEKLSGRTDLVEAELSDLVTDDILAKIETMPEGREHTFAPARDLRWLAATIRNLRGHCASLHQQLEEARKELRALHVGLHAATRPIVREAIDAARSSPERPNT